MKLRICTKYLFFCVWCIFLIPFSVLFLERRHLLCDGFSDIAKRILVSGNDQKMFTFALEIPVDQKLTKADIELFEKACGSSSDRVRVLLCNSILRSDNTNRTAIENLLALTTTGNHWVRVQVACGIQYCSPSDTALNCARMLLNDESPTVRAQILTSLTQSRDDWSIVGNEVVIELRRELDLTVIMWCLRAVARINPKLEGEEVDIVYGYLESHSSHVRQAAIEAIHKIDGKTPKAATCLLLRLRDDQDDDVRQMAAACLSTMRLDASGVEILLECLRRENNKLIKTYIVRSLANQKGHGAVGIGELRNLCEDPYFEHEVVAALSSIGGERADIQEFFQVRLKNAIVRGDRPIVELLEKVVSVR